MPEPGQAAAVQQNQQGGAQGGNGDVNQNLLGAAGNDTEIPEKFYQPEFVEVDKDGKKEKVNFDFDGMKIPEKMIVKNEDGSVNHEKTAKRILASTKKAVSSYSALEKRLGSHEAPPEKEDGYKLDYAKIPENMRPTPESEKSFLKYFHGHGLNNKQAQAMMDKYAELLLSGVEIQNRTVPEVEGELQKAWGDKFEGNVGAARVAINTLLEDEDKGDIGKIGFDLKTTYRMLMKVLAKVGADLQEDNPPAGDAAGAEAIDTLQKSEAYWNPKHAEHAATVRKVQEFYKKKYPEKG
ncbi:MAG: hypothetical protein EPN94_11020 [Nitrospirae bacterium]|nr:MAG: hypothetical protein EPN94_11020 [Nitrospirota bacterium]